MKSKHSLFFIVAFFILGTGVIYSQGDSCSSIQPFCAESSLLVFQNSNAGSGDNPFAESGPDYNCLLTQPYPAWFYLKIGDSGDVDFTISQTENADGTGRTLDVDFITWGPFSEQDEICSNTSLSNQNLIACSYSDSPTESFSINNAVQGEIYVVLITNFDEGPGYISLQQTNTDTGGSTDCTIVGSSLGPDQKVCGESQVILDATNPSASQYTWFLFDETSETYEVINNETGPTLTVEETGNYRVTIRSELLDDEASDDILVEFFDIPVANEPQSVTGCDTGEGVVFDLTRAEPGLIGDNSGAFSSNYYLTEEDFQNNNPITAPENFNGDVQTVFGTIISELSGCESLPQEVNLTIADIPEIDWSEETVLCIDFDANIVAPVSIGVDLGNDYVYEWSLPNDPDNDGEQNPVLILDEYPAQNTITLTIQNTNTGCINTYSTNIKFYSPPGEVLLEVTGRDIGGEGYQITATTAGAIGDEATYEYRLNNGPWQLEPTFFGVPGGTHRVTAREINGCGTATSEPIRLIGYPRFFTPNNDGYNDTWNVINDADVSISKVFIFDRYGKLLKQLDPASGGWDGTYNNRVLPADDYWFLVEYRDSDSEGVQQFKGNFTLKR